MDKRMDSTLDVLVIGASQAGLAFGYHLKHSGLEFLLVDQHERVGDSWRNRFESLVLFTPRSYSALPGLPVPGDPESYPTKDEIADYLEAYAEHIDLPVSLSTRIERLERMDGAFVATSDSGRAFASRAVVLATGAFQEPAIPPIAQKLAGDIVQLTPQDYRNPQQTPSGTVLVVGDGATGRQIARELTTTHRVLLSTGRARRVSPNRILGKNIFWWMDKLGLIRKSRNTAIGRFMMKADPFPGKELELDKLRSHGVTVVGRLVEAAGRTVSFSDSQTAEIDVVIWATGYRDVTDWVAIPEAKDASGAVIEDRGISPVPGLAFIGRSWQWTRGSALLTGVGADAEYVVQHLKGTIGEQQDVPARALSGRLARSEGGVGQILVN